MKRILSSVLFLFVLCVPSWAALSTSLISYWPGNEASGNLLDSVVASANNLTDTNTVTSNPGKVYATARQYTAASFEYHTIADNALVSVGGTAFSISAWVYFDTIDGTERAIVSKDDGTNREYLLYLDNSNRMIFVTWTATGGVGAAVATTTTFGTLSANTWYFVTATSDQTTNKISINAGTQDSISAVNAGWNGGTAFRVGVSHSPLTRYMNGRIGPVMFWKRALSGAEITQVYNGGAGMTYEDMTGGGGGGPTYDLTNLISYWALDEASGTRADKVVATANTLTDNNTVTQAVGKVYPNAALFTGGNNEFLSHTDNSSLSVGGTAFTFIAWVYANAYPTFGAIIDKDDGATSSEYVLYYDTVGRFKFGTYTGASQVGNVNVTANNFGTPPTATWMMIAVTSDQTNNKISVNAGTQDSVSAPSAGWNGTAPFLIGGISGAYWDGRIGPVLFYKRALSAAEITDLYNSGNGVTYSALTAVAGAGNTTWLTQQQRRRR